MDHTAEMAEGFEKHLIQKAQQYNVPISGVLELTPLCNMRCKMCYVTLSHDEMKQRGRMLSADEWIAIAEKAKSNGTLFLLLTGGEPLLYPEFSRLYRVLSEMGFIININTNGTLITEKHIALFKEYPVRRLNITIYGSDDETYGRLCGNPQGFTKLMRAVRLLKENRIPFRFNYTVTKDNAHCLEKIYEIANEHQIYVSQATYLFPPVRRDGEMFNRLSAEASAETIIKGNFIKKHLDTDALRRKSAMDSLRPVDEPLKNHAAGYSCSAGHREYFVNWKGEMFPCGVFEEPKISLLNHSFEESWQFLVREVKKLEERVCETCETCKKRNVCLTCLAARFCETGSFSGKPQYLCDMVDRELKLVFPYLSDDEKKRYKYLLEEHSCNSEITSIE